MTLRTVTAEPADVGFSTLIDDPLLNRDRVTNNDNVIRTHVYFIDYFAFGLNAYATSNVSGKAVRVTAVPPILPTPKQMREFSVECERIQKTTRQHTAP